MAITVCIVDDDAGIRDSISAYIAGAPGFACLGTFASGEEAVKAIPPLAPDIVLMDVQLPGMSGAHCVRKLKDKLPSMQAMMLTVYENSDRIFEALSAGASGYLLKSTPPASLLEAITDMKNGGSPMSSHIARKVVQAFHRAAPAVQGTARLTTREQDVLNLLARGFAYKQIAAQLNLSMGTICTHIRGIYDKLHVNSRTEAVVKYLAGQKPGH